MRLSALPCHRLTSASLNKGPLTLIDNRGGHIFVESGNITPNQVPSNFQSHPGLASCTDGDTRYQAIYVPMPANACQCLPSAQTKSPYTSFSRASPPSLSPPQCNTGLTVLPRACLRTIEGRSSDKNARQRTSAHLQRKGQRPSARNAPLGQSRAERSPPSRGRSSGRLAADEVGWRVAIGYRSAVAAGQRGVLILVACRRTNAHAALLHVKLRCTYDLLPPITTSISQLAQSRPRSGGMMFFNT